MTDTPDPLTAIETHGWRLDKRRDAQQWRCMFWCEKCGGLWRCVVDTGEWFNSPLDAVTAAMSGKSDEARDGV